jgi:hypothetical protein
MKDAVLIKCIVAIFDCMGVVLVMDDCEGASVSILVVVVVPAIVEVLVEFDGTAMLMVAELSKDEAVVVVFSDSSSICKAVSIGRKS